MKTVKADRINLTWRDGQYRVDIPGSDVLGEYVRAEEYDALEALLASLKGIAERMDGQDNRATANPIFVVQQKLRIYGVDFDYDEGKVWLYDGVEVATDQEGLMHFLSENEMMQWEAEERGGLIERGYRDIYEFVQPFFSQKAADDYIEANRHNLTDPRVYVDSAYRNTEWQAVRGVLLAMEEMNND